MFWLSTAVLGQLALAPPTPQTGHVALDTVIYLAGGILSLLGLREGTWWIRTLRDRKHSNGHAERQSRDAEIQWRTAQIQKETLHELEELRREGREAHTRIENSLAEVLRNQRGG